MIGQKMATQRSGVEDSDQGDVSWSQPERHKRQELARPVDWAPVDREDYVERLLKFKSHGQGNSVAGARIKNVWEAVFWKEHHELSLKYPQNTHVVQLGQYDGLKKGMEFGSRHFSLSLTGR